MSIKKESKLELSNGDIQGMWALYREYTTGGYELELYHAGHSIYLEPFQWARLRNYMQEVCPEPIIISQEYEIAKRKGEE